MLVKSPHTDPTVIRVTFTFPGDIWAESVCLAGDFNGWDQECLPLARSRADDDDWEITLELEKGKVYEYRYLINGNTWVNDSNADGYVANPYGAPTRW